VNSILLCGCEPGVELGEGGFWVKLVNGEGALGVLIGLRMSLVVCWGNCEKISILQVERVFAHGGRNMAGIRS
jgi:hypothetical protein